MSDGRGLRMLLRRPEQGWSSLILLLGLLAVVGTSVADARPLWLAPDAGPVTDALVPLMVVAGLVGYLLARSSIGLVRAHILAATVAAALLLLIAGAALIEGEGPLPTSLDGIGERVTQVRLRLGADVADYLTSPDSPPTPTMATFLVLGAICWTTGQFGAFSVFRHRRAGPAVMAAGAVLFLNVGLGTLEPGSAQLPLIPVLAAYSALAMLLLIRLQLNHQRRLWARRHITDSGEVSRLFLRSGVVFVAVTVLAASSLTAWATVEPQEVDLGELQPMAEDWGRELNRVLGFFGVPSTPQARTTIGDSWSISPTWQPGDGVAFRARLDAGQLRGNYWWGWADDSFDGRVWSHDPLETLQLDADEPLPWPALTSAGGEQHVAIATVTVEDQSLAQGMAMRLAEADSFDRAVTARVVDAGGGISPIFYQQTLDRGDSVTVASSVRDYSEDATSLTAADLRAADDEPYPPWVLGRYLQGRNDPRVSGARVEALAADITAEERTAYDRALAVQRVLRSMAYDTDMAGACRDGEPIPECTLRIERGFCQHYATTMVVLLRAMDIPARIVTGYLPGDLADGEWVVPQAAFHNWAEAYFPGIGWVRFDPTPGDDFGRERTNLPPGPRATPTPGPGSEPTELPDEDPPPDETEPPDEGIPDEPPPPGDDPTAALLIGGGLVLVLGAALAGLLLFRFQRLPGADGSLAYRGIVSLATRLGYGPHPAQTEYEFAGSLSKVIPTVRDDLYVVVGTRVETAYGRRSVDADHLGALRRAYARVRTALLRMWLRLRR